MKREIASIIVFVEISLLWIYQPEIPSYGMGTLILASVLLIIGACGGKE